MLVIEPAGYARLVKVEVVYVNETGLGVAFVQPEPALCNYLRQVASHAPTQRREGRPAPAEIDQTARPVLDGLAEQANAYLEAQFDRFLVITREELIKAADRSSQNDEQADLFFAVNTLEKQGGRIKHGFLNRVAAGFREVKTEVAAFKHQSQGLEGALELVEKKEYDEWLMLDGLSHRLDPRVAHANQQLQVVLSRILHCPVTDEANPISPISLLVQLQKAIAAEQFAPTVKSILYIAFSRAVFGNMPRLYGQIDSFLREQGFELAAADPAPAASAGPRPGGRASTPSPHQVSRTRPSPERHRPAQSLVADDARRSSFSTSASRMESDASLPIEQGWSVVKQLEALLRDATDRPPSRDRLTPPAQDPGDELLASIKQDELLHGPAGELLERLEVPFIKSAFNDLALLDDSSGAGRRFFQAFQGLAPYCNTHQKSNLRGGQVMQDMSQLVERIEQGELTHINQVTEQMEQLQERQKALFERNRNLAIEGFKRNEKLRKVYAQVKTSLQQLLLGESVSTVLVQLFRYGWANLLIQTAMLHGPDSEGLKAYLRVVEVLHRLFGSARIQPELSEEHRRDLLQTVKRGFTEYPVHPEGTERFIIDLQGALNDPIAARHHIDERLQVDERYLAALFLGQAGFTEDQKEQPPVEARWLEQVDRLETGSWLRFHPRSGESRMVNLAWKTTDSKRYLLIDGNGLKVMEANAHQLARQFAEGNLALPRDMNLPLLDRALQRMLGKTYETIEQQVSHDELTGLMNRRAFERRLNELLHGECDDSPHILIMLDVDQFGLVNDLCGFEGGDKLLQEITHLLHNCLPSNALLARSGDDEFTILMPDSNLDQGFQLAETQRLSLDAFRYSWAKQMIPVSASLGVVEIIGRTQTSGELLKAAAAACSIAKQAGRNCTRVYRDDDKAVLEHRRLIRSAANIEDALARDRIILVGQPIAPLQEGDRTCHYEILLRVLDDNDNLQSPFHFISAAERYDLMRSVDRWVIRRFFNMLNERHGEIAKLGGFSLNLSGQSVADAEFRVFLRQQIVSSPLPREWLGFEITETAMVKDTQDVIRFIDEIRALGCRFYLDDFGSGYASFAYLKDLPVDYVKIDGIFIKGILDDPASQTMVKSVTEIAHYMQRRVVAEFVEDQPTADLLQGFGVDFIQGYHIGRPLPLKEILWADSPCRNCC
jgi:diguanylate cyclase (GGDEF)-like protein